MKIIWSNQAQKDYYKLLAYLDENWGQNQVRSFVEKTEEVIRVIQKHPQTFVESAQKRNFRKGFITKHNSLFYKLDLIKRK